MVIATRLFSNARLIGRSKQRAFESKVTAVTNSFLFDYSIESNGYFVLRAFVNATISFTKSCLQCCIFILKDTSINAV